MSSNAEKPEMALTYSDKYQIPTVTLHEVGWHIDSALRWGQKRGVICMIADAGVGKSQLVHQVAKKYGRRVVDIRTAAFSLIAAGVPQRADENGHFRIAVPDDMPKPGEKAILFFDEVNQGQPHALSMFFKLLEDRGLFNYALPDDCLVICAMNPATSGYQVSKIENLAAYNRRMQKFYIVESTAEFISHAETAAFHEGKHPCHPLVLGFLKSKGSALYDKPSRDKGQQFACPATWQTVSECFYNVEDDLSKLATDKRRDGIQLTSNYVTNRVASSIGMLAAAEFMRYVRDTESLIDPEELLLHYKEEDRSIRARTKKQIKNPDGQILELVPIVATMLVTKRFDIKTTGPHFCAFWSDLPMESAQSVYSALAAAVMDPVEAESKARRKYMQDLTTWAVENCDDYNKMNDRITAATKKERAEIEGTTDESNPLPASRKKK